MPAYFTPARKEKLSTEIIRQIREAILCGALKQGDTLSSEKELMTQFGVSKHTIREALRTLEGMGLINVKRGAGGGPEVSSIDWKTAREGFAGFLHFQDISIDELSEVRKLIEPYIARKAAEVFDNAAIEELRATHETCRKLVESGQNLIGGGPEIMFHVLLGKHTGNKVLWVILDFVNNVLAETKKAMQPSLEFSKEVQAAHQKIVDAIVSGDPEGAERCMYEHICEVQEGLKRCAEKLDT